MSVLVDYLHYCSLVKLELRLVQAMLLRLFRYEIVLGDLILLLSKISAHIDHLHTVLESRLDVLDVVRSSDKQYIRQIVVDIEVVIVECRILLRIKSLKKC